MAALTSDRATATSPSEYRQLATNALIAATTTLWRGGLVAQSGGVLVPASDTAGLTVLGVAADRLINATAAPALSTQTPRGGVFAVAPLRGAPLTK